MNQKSNPPDRVLVDGTNYNVMSVRDGGMGRVWILARADDSHPSPVYRPTIAVKTFDFISDHHAVEKELNIWIGLVHPSILPLLAIGRLNYRLAAIMPRLHGTLDDLLEQQGKLGEREVVRILLAVAEGLDHAWVRHGVLHLDLKPSNILIGNSVDSKIKIADWGISRTQSDRRLRTAMNTEIVTGRRFDQKTTYSAGTPLYMAPERFSGNWTLSPTVDIYSLGLLGIHLSTGILPFRFGLVDPLHEIVNGELQENAAQILVNTSDRFRRFCIGCIDPDSEVRPKNYRATIRQLRKI